MKRQHDSGGRMILYLSFEELTALSAEAERVLTAGEPVGHGIAAPPAFLAEVEQFAQLLVGDVAVETLEQQRSMRRVVDYLLDRCHRRMERHVVEQHAAAESAVAAYFDYAHVLTARHRLDAIGEEMAALVHVLTGKDPESDSGRRFEFPE
jgi:hypothetical protein